MAFAQFQWEERLSTPPLPPGSSPYLGRWWEGQEGFLPLSCWQHAFTSPHRRVGSAVWAGSCLSTAADDFCLFLVKGRTDSFEKTLILERLRAGGEGDDRGWDAWMASPTRWTWVWVTSGTWWWTGRPGVLRVMGSQWVGHDWATELNWTETRVGMPTGFVLVLWMECLCPITPAPHTDLYVEAPAPLGWHWGGPFRN